MEDSNLAERIGFFREILGDIAEKGPGAESASSYRDVRNELLSSSAKPLLPEFVVECRTQRNFWDYIQRAFDGYAERSRYIEAQLLPIERKFRPERQLAPGARPAEVRIEYSPVRPTAAAGSLYVSEDRLAELRTATSTTHDLKKLIRLCEELNVAYAEGCFFATAFLLRALLDHVPPVFGKNTFAEVANNVSGRSLKGVAQRLEDGARHIADAHIHQPIRARESLPVSQQVAFSAELDFLLQEFLNRLT